MTTTSLRDRNRRSATAEIRRAAIALTVARGFDGVTVEQVAAAAGVSPSTVYRYFGTKEALILPTDPDRLAERFRDVLAERPGDTVGRAFRRAVVEVFDDADEVTAWEVVAADVALSSAFEERLLALRPAIAEALAERRSPGGEAKAGDHAVAGALLGTLAATLERWWSGAGAKSLNKTLAKALATVDECELS